jgi:hypothetical protein
MAPEPERRRARIWPKPSLWEEKSPRRQATRTTTLSVSKRCITKQKVRGFGLSDHGAPSLDGRPGLLAGMYTTFCHSAGLARRSAGFDQRDGGASCLT